MSGKTSIEWTELTWNPVRGCTKISPGCKHCYAETFAERWRGTPGHPYAQGFDLRLAPHKLHEPLTWTTPSRIFVNSMSDLYHEDVPDRYLGDVHRVMALASWHTFQVLTKRAERLEAFHIRALDVPNVWLGVSVEDRKYGLPRLDALRRATVGVRFLSIEPLLEDLGELDLRGIAWVIVGGESGHGARPMNPQWVRSIRDQCAAQNTPFFFKQWGAWLDTDGASPLQLSTRSKLLNADGRTFMHLGKKHTGRLLDGRVWDECHPDINKGQLPPHAERRAMIRYAKSWAREWKSHDLAWTGRP